MTTSGATLRNSQESWKAGPLKFARWSARSRRSRKMIPSPVGTKEDGRRHRFTALVPGPREAFEPDRAAVRETEDRLERAADPEASVGGFSQPLRAAELGAVSLDAGADRGRDLHDGVRAHGPGVLPIFIVRL